MWWRNGTSSTAIVSAGNGITKICGAMYRWNIRPCRSRRSCLAGLNNPAVRQLCSGNFLDILFDCPYEMHQLTANAFLSQMIEELSEEHKEILYFLSLRLYSTTQLAQMRSQSDRNIRKVRNTIRKKLQKKLYAHLCRMQDEGKSLTLRERQFMEEYAALLEEKGKDAVIRRENKTKRRKKKAALDDDKDDV